MTFAYILYYIKESNVSKNQDEFVFLCKDIKIRSD